MAPKAKPDSSIPSVVREDIERHNLPCAVLKCAIPGRFYGPGGMDGSATEVPAGSTLVNYFRDVAAIWAVRHQGDRFPCDVLFPDGRFLHMTIGAAESVAATEPQPHVEWDAETQRYVEMAK